MKRKSVDDFQLIEFILSNPGATDEEIGQAVGLSRVQVCRRRNNSDFEHIVEIHFQQSFDILRHAHVTAVNRVCKILNGADDKLALKAASLIFSRMGAPRDAIMQSEQKCKQIIKFNEIDNEYWAKKEEASSDNES